MCTLNICMYQSILKGIPMIFGFNSKRFISIFLITFAIMGYVACVPLTYFANSTLLLLPSSLSEIQSNLESTKEIVNEAETVLSSVSISVDSMILSVSLFDFQSTIDSINSTYYSINVMLNTTAFAVDAVEQNFNDTVAWLASVANDSWILVVAPEIAVEAGNLAASMRSTTQILNSLLIRPTIESLHDLQAYVNVMLTQLKFVNTYVLSQLRTFKTYIKNIINRIGNAKTSIDSWLTKIQNIYETLWIIRFGIYGLIVYILLLHTAFLLIGLSLRKII